MKKAIIFVSSIVAVVAVAITFFVLTSTNTKPLYGRFMHLNEDGSTAVVVLTETTIFCENLVYDEIERVAATHMTIEYLEENNLPVVFGDDFVQKHSEFLEQLDLASIFDSREVPIAETEYNAEYNEYNYVIRTPGDGSPGLYVRVDAGKKELIIVGMVFSYSGR